MYFCVFVDGNDSLKLVNCPSKKPRVFSVYKTFECGEILSCGQFGLSSFFALESVFPREPDQVIKFNL